MYQIDYTSATHNQLKAKCCLLIAGNGPSCAVMQHTSQSIHFSYPKMFIRTFENINFFKMFRNTYKLTFILIKYLPQEWAHRNCAIISAYNLAVLSCGTEFNLMPQSACPLLDYLACSDQTGDITITLSLHHTARHHT